MSVNFLELVNDVNRSLNEVELTSSNFASAVGWYNQAKNSINFALQKIDQKGVEWPFHHTTASVVLTPNQSRYEFPANFKRASENTFRIVGGPLGRTSPLAPLDYEQYIQMYSDMENRPELYAALPRSVFKTPELKYGIAPAPDKAYTLEYEYYRSPPLLELWSDEADYPDSFRYTIVEGALHFAYRFRGDIELSQMSLSNFNDSVKALRLHYIDRNEYLRSTMYWRR